MALFIVRKLKLWCHLCQSRLSRRKDSSSGRKRLAAAKEAVLSALKNRDDSLEKNSRSRGALSQVPWPTRKLSWFISQHKWQICKDHRRSRTATHEGSGDAKFDSSISVWMEDHQKDLKLSARGTTVGLSF